MTQAGSMRGFFQWIRSQFIGDVPEDVSLCEFDCRKVQCTQGDWEACERRLNRAQGELMPSQDARKEPAA